jgi:hypothetical protein
MKKMNAPVVPVVDDEGGREGYNAPVVPVVDEGGKEGYMMVSSLIVLMS